MKVPPNIDTSTGFKVVVGPDVNTPIAAFIFKEAKSIPHAKKLYRDYIKKPYPFPPEDLQSFKKICYIIPMNEK